MGYRSDVMIAFYPANEGRPKRVPYAAIKLWFEENYPQDAGEVVFYPERETITVRYYDTKWYDGYGEVQEVNRAIEKYREAFACDEEEHLANYEFVRIGEEYNDIEVERSGWHDFRLSVERSIHTRF